MNPNATAYAPILYTVTAREVVKTWKIMHNGKVSRVLQVARPNADGQVAMMLSTAGVVYFSQGANVTVVSDN